MYKFLQKLTGIRIQRKGRVASLASYGRLIIPILVVFLALPSDGAGQSFTRITTGDIVNDGGVSWGSSTADYDGDGNLDVFVANNGVNFLYRGNGDGTFTKITAGEIVTDNDDSRGGTWGDYDNDGDLDLFVSNNASDNALYQNNGDGTFTSINNSIIVSDGGAGRSCSWVDFNNDGHLDLWVANFGQDNFLYRNNGDATFAKIISGGIVNDGGNSTGSNWVDYDNDGDLDLFVANFAQNNFLYLNNGNGTFTSITEGDIVSDGATSTGSNWGDYDNDGDMDLFVSNLSDVDNLLYRNSGPPEYTFTKITSEPIGNQGGDSYVSSWVDTDNDGDLELMVANRNNQNQFLYDNSGHPNYTFTNVTTGVLVNDGGNSYGSTWGDFDNDGDQDVFICGLDENNALYRNDGNPNHWINIKAVGIAANPTAIGARISIKATIGGTPIWQMRDIAGQTGYYSQNSIEAEFGLGDATTIDSLVISWQVPSESVDAFTNTSVDQFLTVTQMAEPLPALASFGVCYATTGNTGIMPGHLIRIDPGTGAGTAIGATGLSDVPGLAIKSTGQMFATDTASPANLYRIDALTGAATLVANTGLSNLNAVAFNSGDTLFAVDGNNDFYRINDTTGEGTLIGAVGVNIAGLAFDPTNGSLWGSQGSDQDGIYTIDSSTGAASLVGATGLGGGTPDIHFDEEGNLFGVKNDDLVSIDKSTAAGTIIGPVGLVGVSAMATRLEIIQEPPSRPQLNLTHTAGDLHAGIFNDGSIGASNMGFAGPGVTWKGQNGLFVGGLIFGNSARGSVNGLIGSFGITGDIKIGPNNFADGFSSDNDFDQISEAVLDDSEASNPYGVEIYQSSYSGAGQEYVFIRYGFVNTTNAAISDFYAGVFLDWDIGTAVNNSGGYAPEEDLVYNFDTAGAAYYYGMAALNGLSGMLTSTAGTAAGARAETFTNISTLDTNPIAAPGDFRSWLGTGPFEIAAGDTAWATFAIVAGDDLDGIRANASEARSKAAARGWLAEARMSLTHTSGDLSAGIFNDGSIGAENVGFTGPGVTWKSQNGLFVGGVIFGTADRASVNGLIGSFGINQDIVSVASDFAGGFISNDNFDQVSTAVLNDAGGPEAYGVEIYQGSYSMNGEEFVFLRYGFVNKNDTNLTDFYAGLFLDWDIGTAINNSGGYALDENLIYNFDTGGAPYYYGMAVLDGLAGMLTSTAGTVAGARAEAFANISTLDTNPIVAPGDFRSYAGAGPFDIAAGDTAWATFALVAGDDLDEIRASANAATQKAASLGWIGPVTGIDEGDDLLPSKFLLAQNFPNPFNPSTTITYALPRASQVILKVYDILGREVRTLVDEQQSAGFRSVTWNGKNNHGQSAASGIYVYRIEAGDFTQSRKLLLLK